MSEERRKILEMLGQGKISVDEAEKLLNATANAGKKEIKDLPQFLCIKVDGDQKVNIRVPIQLIRSGIKFASLIPSDVSDRVCDKLRAKGINLDKLDPEALDSLILSLKDLSIDVDEEKEKVKIYCE